MKNIIRNLLIGSIILGFSGYLKAENPSVKPGAPLFNDLGFFHYPISTKVPLAQRFFDQGLAIYSYSFSYSLESIRSFREAIRLDPTCAMCYWGLALALNSKSYMMSEEDTDKTEGYTAIRKAQQWVDPNNASEKAYISALLKRYAVDKNTHPININQVELGNATQSTVSDSELRDYANAMKTVVKQFPKDVLAKYLYVVALSDINRWQFYMRDGKPKPSTSEIVKTLEEILKIDPQNLPANHIYVHVIEQSPHPENAFKSSGILMHAPEGSEHLLHMPSHIYFLTGDYHESINVNQKAISAFKQYQVNSRKQEFEPEINNDFNHDFHTLWASAMMEGNSHLALKSAKELIEMIPMSELQKDASLQMYLPAPLLTEVRFGKWNEILKEPKPEAQYQYVIGLWHYARGIAYEKLKKLKEAESELTELKNIEKQGAVTKNLGHMGHEQLEIAVQVLSAVLAEQKNETRQVIDYLQEAVGLQDKMEFHTPPSWYFPIREALGYALLKSNQPNEAIKVFQQSLKDRPKNGWVLYGLSIALRQVGKIQESDQVENEFKKAWQYADIETPISLFWNK